MEMFPKFIAAAVQAAPVFLDREATTARACELIREAARGGAKLVVFPEVFIPGYPYWNWLDTPYEGSKWFRRLYLQSVDVPGPVTDVLCRVAREEGVYVVMGVNERDPMSVGTIYNTNIIIGPSGDILGKHRKLVPTWAEKLTWTAGDGSSLVTYPTEVGRLGTLICGENTNTLARFALLAQGELVHAANFPSFGFSDQYDMPEAIRIRAGAHAFEGKVFCVVSSSTMSDEIVDMLADTDAKRKQLTSTPNAFSGIFGPDGRTISEPLIDREGICFGEIDLELCIEPRQLHNITGHYNRFDVFDLQVDRTPRNSVRFVSSAQPREERQTDSGEDVGIDAGAEDAATRNSVSSENLGRWGQAGDETRRASN